MEFNLDLFRAFANQNQSYEMINKANQLIADNIGNPNLALFILNTFSTPEVQNDQIITQVMVIIFYKIVDFVWHLYPDKIQRYSPEVFSQIREQIFAFYFNTPAQFQHIIIDALGIVIKFESANSEDILSNVLALLNSAQDLHNISFVFRVLEFYADDVSIPKSDNVNRGEPFCEKFLEIWSSILPQLQESFSTQPQADSYQILKSTAIIMKHLIKKTAEASLLKPQTANMIQFFLGALIFQSNETECINMKESILLFFNESLNLARDKQRKQYVEPIQQSFLTSLFQNSQQLFSTVSNNETINALGVLMNIFYALIHNKISPEWFLSSNFLYHILLPSARLTPNDLNEFETSPEQYYGLYLYDKKNSKETGGDYIPRIECASIIEELIPNASSLLISDFSQFTNPLDLEAYLYLIYQGFNSRKKSYMLEGQIFLQIFGLLNTPDLPQFLYPTILCALKNTFILSNYEIMKAISSASYQIIINPQVNQVSTICALSLFRSTIITLAEHEELESSINIEQFIPRLIEISSSINTPEVQIIMQHLTNLCTSSMRKFSRVLFVQFSRFLEDISKLNSDINSQQEDELAQIINTFSLLFDIQNDINEKLWFAEQIITISVNILHAYPNSAGVELLIELCIEICQKTDLVNTSDEVKVIFMKLAQFVLAYLPSSEDSIYLLPNIGGIFTSLMPFLDTEIIQNIQTFCINITRQENMEYLSFPALLIMCDIVLVHGINVTEIFQFAINLMRGMDDISETFIGCIFVLTSVLFKTNGECAKSIPDDIMAKWFEASTIDFLNNAREIRIFSLGLLILASNENKQAFKVAGDLLYQQYEKNISDNDENIFQEEEDDEFMEGDDECSQIILPIDKENVYKLFLQLVEKYGIPNNYPEPEPFSKWLLEKASKDK